MPMTEISSDIKLYFINFHLSFKSTSGQGREAQALPGFVGHSFRRLFDEYLPPPVAALVDSRLEPEMFFPGIHLCRRLYITNLVLTSVNELPVNVLKCLV
ncbi:hypothetical protein O3G_MSEX015171 [Manduca sexta]|uniref:Uncharacterized protein n=1 Tax=Manduca sexta TaxID=7130 RepID=A0A922D0Y6_MANSE|nr:hypothetical protein O3G_MSEX015171 [Manduca sexta]